MQTLRPPVKWPGGKAYLAKWIISHFPKHRIYVEPYGGAASVLLNKPIVDVETFNDLDERITRLFKVLREDGDAFRQKIQLVPYSQLEFERAERYPIGAGDLEKAICDFIRWRQSFSGKGKTFSHTTSRARGGMAGDVNAWWTAIEMLPEIIDRFRRVQLLCMNGVKVIKKFDHEDALFYCDPPYLPETREKGSRNIFNVEMSVPGHKALANQLNQCKGKVVLSGYSSNLYNQLYKNWRVVEQDIANHAAGGKKKRRMLECLWMNF